MTLMVWLRRVILACWVLSPLVTGGCGGVRRSERLLVPAGYVGWIEVQYGVKGAPPLPIENGWYVIRIPPEGRLQTSSEYQDGWAADEFWYYSGSRRWPVRAASPFGFTAFDKVKSVWQFI